MELTSLRFAAAIFALGCGATNAQTIDSGSTRQDSLAPIVAPVVESAAVQGNAPAVRNAAVTDTGSGIVKPDSIVKPVVDSVVTPLVKPDSSASPVNTKMAAFDSSRCGRKPVWSIEGTVRYGWRLGELLAEEDRLTRQFKVVLVDKNDDTSDVNPVASGISYQFALWLKACGGNQLGVGFEYAQLSEHPVTTYSAALTEDFMEQFLVTARYRKASKVTERFHLLYELAAGYSRTTIHGIPLVYSNRNEPNIHLTPSDLASIDDLHRAVDANGIHAELGIGGEFRPSAPVGLMVKLGVNTDKIWRETSISAGRSAASPYNAADFWMWGFDIGLSASHDF